MGNPHCVIFFNEDDVDDLDPYAHRTQVRASSAVPRTHQHRIRERPAGRQPARCASGSAARGETWACGTGACATGVAACLNGFCKPDTDITVHLRGGDLTIRYTTETVFMTGAATTVFKGEIEL